ncbi:hypothetical protein HWV62_23699 [Athelia sp. TMB]|nr:hypothetical protein HWV62_23699 [Athelia sp. TMB]
MSTTSSNPQVELGLPVPPHSAHAISVSLPTWNDNVGYEEGEKRVVDAMVSGYPRFFIHLSIQKLARICEQKFGSGNERCLLCPTKKVAEECRAFMIDRSTKEGTPVSPRLIQYFICPEDTPTSPAADPGPSRCAELHIVLFPADAFPLAKQFWQHTGLGISSRLADHCLAMLPAEPTPSRAPAPPPTKGKNKHYAAKGKPSNANGSGTGPASPPPTPTLGNDESTYLEERYGRNLPVGAADAAKRALRRRIAGVLLRDGDSDDAVGPSARGAGVGEGDVFLFPTGMAAIWSAHALARATRPSAKSVCFGFPYTDTLKVLQKWGPGCHFLGHGLDADIDALEKIIQSSLAAAPDEKPLLALFTEFPSNPLLRAADLPRLRALADKHDFLIVIDETLGNFVNVEVLPHADIVVSSLSKIFSGDANVMGGSLVLNPAGRHYARLRAHMDAAYEDAYFGADAVYMERNSRDFARRIARIDASTRAVATFLHTKAGAGVVKDVHYPQWTTRARYDACRLPAGGFGGLFSVTFAASAAARAFFDALPCWKGPSLGTNFTLACPYTVLAHYTEMGWAAEFGVEESLVRVSVGMEDAEELVRSFAGALKAAEDAIATSA